MDFLNQLPKTQVIQSSFEKDNYVFLDLSVTNEELAKIDVSNTNDFQDYLNDLYQKSNAKIAYGGYNEKRNLYRKSNVFKQNETKERDIHIGLDLWIEAETPILAAYDGEIHSFQNNEGYGNYGPTIILKHEHNGEIFHTLYGHLSVKSLENKTIGQKVKQGETIATLGDESVNGNYAPHLHFQLIKDMQSHHGDYPGVCHKDDLEYYVTNCPNPEQVLNLQ